MKTREREKKGKEVVVVVQAAPALIGTERVCERVCNPLEKRASEGLGWSLLSSRRDDVRPETQNIFFLFSARLIGLGRLIKNA